MWSSPFEIGCNGMMSHLMTIMLHNEFPGPNCGHNSRTTCRWTLLITSSHLRVNVGKTPHKSTGKPARAFSAFSRSCIQLVQFEDSPKMQIPLLLCVGYMTCSRFCGWEMGNQPFGCWPNSVTNPFWQNAESASIGQSENIHLHVIF